MFNMMLPEGMDFYNYPMKSGDLAVVISDCYQTLGRRETINLLDDMNQLGFPGKHQERFVVCDR